MTNAYVAALAVLAAIAAAGMGGCGGAVTPNDGGKACMAAGGACYLPSAFGCTTGPQDSCPNGYECCLSPSGVVSAPDAAHVPDAVVVTVDATVAPDAAGDGGLQACYEMCGLNCVGDTACIEMCETNCQAR